MKARLFRFPAKVMLLCAGSFVFAQAADKNILLQPREKFPLELPKLFVSSDYVTKEFDGVRVTFPPDYSDRIFIGIYDDMYIKKSSHGRKKVLYRELPERACFFSKFEAKNIIKVNDYFIGALEVFGLLLKKKNWGRCLYFDTYFPRFLDGYYSLVGAARNSECALPFGARIPAEEYDVSQNSLKSDARINRWRSSPDIIIQLRIAGKELAHQLKKWEKNLGKVKNDVDAGVPKELENALVVFVRTYFGLKSSPVFPKRKRLMR